MFKKIVSILLFCIILAVPVTAETKEDIKPPLKACLINSTLNIGIMPN